VLDGAAPDCVACAIAGLCALEQNDRLLERNWHQLPRAVQDQIWMHLRYYLHSVLVVSWMADSTPDVSARSLAFPEGNNPCRFPCKTRWASRTVVADFRLRRQVARSADRLKTAIAELGYQAVIEDLLSPELIGGEDSLLRSEDVMAAPAIWRTLPGRSSWLRRRVRAAKSPSLSPWSCGRSRHV
jgi:hypothetical protein